MMFQLKIPQEVNRKVFELTLALYRVTDFFPQHEVLRRQLREKANEIFGSVIEYGHGDGFNKEALSAIAKIQTIKGYLDISGKMNFVKAINILILEREYDFLAGFFQKDLEYWSAGEKLGNADDLNSEKTNGVVETPDEDKAESEKVPEPQKVNVSYMSDKKNEYDQPRPYSIGLSHISFDTSERQKVIMDLMKKNNQAKISDFYSIFSGISSKTIQRDLQDLVSRNFLRKAGEKRWTVYSLS